MTFSLAIVGRPNVGKSTLFNRLVGRRLALVDDQPGVTRDLREGEARLGDLRFTAIDTAGLEEATDESLQGRMRKLTERAVGMADICLFVLDARAGVTAADQMFADILRKKNAHVILAVNKAEGHAGDQGAMDAWSLGLGEPLRISAEHGEGMDDLYRVLQPLADGFAERDRHDAPEVDVAVSDDDPDDGPRTPTREKPLQIAVIGRPNAGKSTLINSILGEDRLLTGPEAGITRDAISISADWMGTPIRIFDTAGMRKRSKIDDKLEKLSVADGLRAVRFAEVVVVLIDVAIPFETQDLRIADFAETEGRAIVLAANKWDLEDDKSNKARELREAFERLLPQMRGAPLVTISGKTGRGLDKLHDAILQGARGLEPPRADRASEHLARRDGRGASAARARRPPDQDALHDAGQDAAPGLRGDGQPRRPAARKLFALSGQRPARTFRHAGHADPPDLPRSGGQEPLQEPEKGHPLAADQAQGRAAEALTARILCSEVSLGSGAAPRSAACMMRRLALSATRPSQKAHTPMKFLDLCKVYIRSGGGGSGCVSFRREKFVEFGGPDGGDGGTGGSVWAEAVDGLNTLIDFRYQQHFYAKSGKPGMGKQMTGASGDDIVLKVPAGTEIIDEDEETVIADLTSVGQRVLLAQGGNGGWGNLRFKSSTNRAPRGPIRGSRGSSERSGCA